MSDQNVIEGLNGLLADAVIFYYKLHNYHWNVRGPQFFTLHDKFEELYKEWADLADELAERVLALGGIPLPTLSIALQNAEVQEESGSPNASDMVAQVRADMHLQRDRMKRVSEMAQRAGDKSTENLIDEFLDSSAKHIWMFSAFLGQSANED